MKITRPHWYAIAVAGSYGNYKETPKETDWFDIWDAYERHQIFCKAMHSRWIYSGHRNSAEALERQHIQAQMTDNMYSSSGRFKANRDALREVEKLMGQI